MGKNNPLTQGPKIWPLVILRNRKWKEASPLVISCCIRVSRVKCLLLFSSWFRRKIRCLATFSLLLYINHRSQNMQEKGIYSSTTCYLKYFTQPLSLLIFSLLLHFYSAHSEPNKLVISRKTTEMQSLLWNITYLNALRCLLFLVKSTMNFHCCMYLLAEIVSNSSLCVPVSASTESV